MKNKQSKTNTHLSRTRLLSDDGPVPLPEDLSIPTVRKDDRQEMRLLPRLGEPEPGRRRRSSAREARGGLAGQRDGDVRQLLRDAVRTSLMGQTSLAQFAKTFLMLPKARAGPEKQSDGLAAV